MKIAIRRIGNSRGVIIPAAILSEVGLDDEADIRIKDGALVISPPKKSVRAGWAEASKKLALVGDDSLVMPEFDNVGDADLKW